MSYRLILATSPGRVDTGANYPNCSRTNLAACDPQQFASTDDAIAYAQARGETPIGVSTAEDAWNVIEGKKPVTTSMVLQPGGGGLLSNPLVLGLGALLLLKFMRR